MRLKITRTRTLNTAKERRRIMSAFKHRKETRNKLLEFLALFESLRWRDCLELLRTAWWRADDPEGEHPRLEFIDPEYLDLLVAAHYGDIEITKAGGTMTTRTAEEWYRRSFDIRLDCDKEFGRRGRQFIRLPPGEARAMAIIRDNLAGIIKSGWTSTSVRGYHQRWLIVRSEA